MKLLRRAAGALAAAATLITAPGAAALDIVLTNDDGFESALTYAVYQRLQAAGHRVLIAGATADQSARGGSLDFLRPVGPLTAPTRGGCVVPPVSPPTPGVGNLGVGTPVASALYGIDVAALTRFGKQADLVISGPNFGNNTGLINNSSGTVNAALIAINRGIPAIAVSAAEPTTYRSLRAGLQPVDVEIADVVVRLVAALDVGASGHRHAPPLMPAGIGLNVNLPRFAPGAAATLPFRLSVVGTAPSVTPVFLADLCADAATKAILGAACAGATPPLLSGVSIVFRGAPLPPGLSSITDNDPRSEQNVVNAGAVAVSVIGGNHDASRDAQRRVARSLRGLIERSGRDDD